MTMTIVPTTICAAGVFCKHPEVDITTSTHCCFYCTERMHCALWCGESWLTLVTTTNISIDSLTPAGREKVTHGDHETLNMCHACINKVMQAPTTNEQDSNQGASSSTDVKIPSLPPISFMSSIGWSSVMKWRFVKPSNCRSPYWNYFLKFDIAHKDKADVAVCKLCLDEGKHNEFSTKDGNTSSLIGHIKNIHVSIYDMMQVNDQSIPQQGKKMNSSITSFLKPKRTTDVVKHLYIKAATASIIDNALPLSVVESESFRRIFLPLNKDAERMVNITSRTIRTAILNMGRMTKEATVKELTSNKLSYTLDHWTGPNNWTYGAVTGHHINPNTWKMNSCLLVMPT